MAGTSSQSVPTIDPPPPHTHLLSTPEGPKCPRITSLKFSPLPPSGLLFSPGTPHTKPHTQQRRKQHFQQTIFLSRQTIFRTHKTQSRATATCGAPMARNHVAQTVVTPARLSAANNHQHPQHFAALPPPRNDSEFCMFILIETTGDEIPRQLFLMGHGSASTEATRLLYQPEVLAPQKGGTHSHKETSAV